jgi:hypothetical protein
MGNQILAIHSHSTSNNILWHNLLTAKKINKKNLVPSFLKKISRKMQESDFKDCCRFCLESGAKDRIDIDDSLRKKYREITNLEVSDESFKNSNSLISFCGFPAHNFRGLLTIFMQKMRGQHRHLSINQKILNPKPRMAHKPENQN